MATMDSTLASAVPDRGGLNVSWRDGQTFHFHPVWLRERLDDGQTLDRRTRQRQIDAGLIPLNLILESAAASTDACLQLAFSDGAAGTVRISDLRRAIEPQDEIDLVGGKELWDGSRKGFPKHRLEELIESPGRLLTLLNDLARLGCVLVTDVPSEKNGLLQFAQLIGNIKLTNWGGVEDIRVSSNAFDLSLTGRALEPHVDNPYRSSTVGYVLLHCLHNSCEGGESTVVDGFHVAHRLRQEHPQAFRTLATTQVYFRYEDESAILENQRPLIALSRDDRVVSVAYSNRTELVQPLPMEEMAQFYQARKLFAEMIYSREATVEFKLQPGQLAIFDNYRVLHGRRGFDSAHGERYMRQAYFDRDMVSSRQKVLLRDVETESA